MVAELALIYLAISSLTILIVIAVSLRPDSRGNRHLYLTPVSLTWAVFAFFLWPLFWGIVAYDKLIEGW